MSEEKTVTQKAVAKEPQKRKERNRINGTRTKLEISGQEAGFHYAWINDEFVGTFEDCGYEFVSHPVKVGNKHIDVSQMQGAKVSRNVGGGVIAYLMRIPQVLYDEDMALEQKEKVDAKEAAIFGDLNSNGLVGTIRKGSDVWAEPMPDIFKK
jgi:hypothetical protein